jgi:tryptophan-rich sensory protein
MNSLQIGTFIATYVLFSLSGFFFRLDQTWYKQLKKPSWTPKGATIGLIWIVLYGCISLATALIIKDLSWSTLIVFSINWLFNQSFTYWMFKRKNLHASFITAVLTCFTALLLLICYADTHKLAGILLFPYVLWTAIASTLAWSISSANKSKTL